MLAIIKQFVRRMLMGKGKGILKIPPQSKVDEFAIELHKKFKQNGISDEAVKTPQDVKIIWNQITNREAEILHTNLTDILGPSGLRKTPLPKKSADVFDLTGKKIKPGETIIGGKGVKKDETVRGIMNTIESRMDKINKILADEKKLKDWKPSKRNINYEKMEEKLGIKLLRNENLDELVEIEKRIKEGTFPRHQRRYDEAVALEDSKIAKDKYHIPDIIDPEDFAYGGLAGMLGEPTYSDGGRIGFKLG